VPAAEFDLIDAFVAAHGIDATVAREANALVQSLSLRRWSGSDGATHVNVNWCTIATSRTYRIEPCYTEPMDDEVTPWRRGR